jgi:stearoyl-CoA desaturase (Delta-9 desaturase)
MAILIFFIAHWYFSLFFQTFYLHRYSAHQQFTMNTFWERFFYLCTFLTQGSSFLNPRAYGLMHRMHHAYADTEKDPHSPKYDPNVFIMMWKTLKVYDGIKKRNLDVPKELDGGTPVWEWFDNLIGGRWVDVLWSTAYLGFYVVFATEWWMFFIWPLHIFMGPIHGAIINYAAHKWGYRNFEMENTSVNLMPWDIFMMGEGLHNNHHRHALNPSFASRFYEFDPSYPVIRTLNTLGIIHIKGSKFPVD